MPPTNAKPLAFLFRGLVATIALAALVSGGMYWFAARTETENQWVRQTLALRNRIAEVLLLVQRCETSQRGYLLTGRDLYLAPFEDASAALPRAVERLAQAANPQAPEVGQLRRLIAAKVKELRSTLDVYKAGRSEEALATINNDIGQRMMDEIRRVAAAIEQQENVTLAARQSDSALFGMLLKVGAGAALALIGAIGILLLVLNRRSFESSAPRMIAWSIRTGNC